MKIIDLKKKFGENLKTLRTTLNLTQEELGKKILVTKQVIYRYENGLIAPGLAHLNYLHDDLNVNLHWLLSGKGDMFLRPRQVTDSSNFQLVPVIGAAACGGSGKILEKDIETYKAFEIGFLRNFKNPVLTRAKGDSMIPVITDGDLLLCDRDPYKCQHPDPKSIYLVNHPDSIDEVSIKVKKLSLSRKTLTLIPLNPAFPPAAVDVTEKSILDIVLGRIVWIGRELE